MSGVVPAGDTHEDAEAIPAMQTAMETSKHPPRSMVAPPDSALHKYKGFVAGVFSGITKLSVGHPFDTIKVRLQTTSNAHFHGPLDCVTQTLKKEGLRGLYKGATPPLVGWMAMDSLLVQHHARGRGADDELMFWLGC